MPRQLGWGPGQNNVEPPCNTSACLNLTESAYTVVLQKSIPAQIRRLILHLRNNKGHIDECVGELAFAIRLYKRFL